MKQNPLLFQVPFRCIAAGPSQSGKSTWLVKNYILHKDCVHKRVIVFCHKASIGSGPMKTLKEKFKGEVIFYEGLPQSKDEVENIHQLLSGGRDKDLHDLVFVDDMMNAGERGVPKAFLDDLFSSSRHYGASVINVLQMIHSGGSRKHRMSASYILLWDFPSCQDACAALFRQIAPQSFKRVAEAYRQVTERPHTPFILTLVPHAGILKYRSAWDRALDLAKAGQVTV